MELPAPEHVLGGANLLTRLYEVKDIQASFSKAFVALRGKGR